jgi:hypothetical protein
MDILDQLNQLHLGPEQYAVVQDAYTEIERLREQAKKDWERNFELMKEVGEYQLEEKRLRQALKKLSCNCASNCDLESDDICPSWIARAALKGDE